MKNAQKGFVVPLLIIVVFLIVAGGYFYLQNKKADNTSSVATSTVVLVNPYDGWKTYSNSNFGLQFQYPGDYVATTTQHRFLGGSTGVYVSVKSDINVPPYAEGACGSESSDTLNYEKTLLNNPNNSSILFDSGHDANLASKFSVIGLHKIIESNNGAKILITLQTCQGLADEEAPALLVVEARIFKGNSSALLNFNYPFNTDGSIKVKDIDVVAKQILNNTYSGSEQAFFNQFEKILSTIK